MEILNLDNSIESILKRDGILLGSAGLLSSYLKKHATGKISSKMANAISVKSLAKALKFVELANVASTTVQDLLPHVSEALDWSMALPFNVLNQTIGRIPGIGAVFRWIHNAITKLVTKGADAIGWDGLAVTGSKLVLKDPSEGFETETNFSKPGKKAEWLKDSDGTKDNNEGDENNVAKNEMKNDPKFYENLDLHKTFSIPGAYTKTTVVNGTLATPKIVVHRVIENPVPDRSALVDRLNQKFSLIKAVRGLSATRYSLIDLANYERCAKLALLQYFTLKKVIQAAKTYSLIQTEIGDNIIDALGFVPTEVRTNLASYETLLCQWHRFIANNLPMSGTWIKRLEYMVMANVPDYSDQKVATIHLFAVSMSSVFYDHDNPTSKFTFDCIPHAQNNNYSIMMVNFNNFQSMLPDNLYFQELIADYFGAFGTACMWEDKSYPEYKEPLNLRSADNDLSREQIKNALYMSAKMELISIDAGVPNQKFVIDVDDADAQQLTNYQFGDTYSSTIISQALNYMNLLDYDSYLGQYTGILTLSGLGSNNKLLFPDSNGLGAQCITVPTGASYYSMNNHETIYSLHKDSYSEGEALEISQFKVRSIGLYFSLNAGADAFQAQIIYKTHEYAIQDSVVYTFGSNGSIVIPQRYTICNEVISDDDLQDTESPIDFPDEIMCWTLIDWMPLTHFTFFGYVTADQEYYPRDIAAIDMDAFGSLDDRAFATSINYSIYSLQAASLTVNKNSKRVSNLGDVYKNKANKRG